MKQKAVKAAKPSENENLDLRRLELEERKFEHQKKIDDQRLTYDTKKAPPNLTKWLAIAAIVLSPLVSAVVGIASARLIFDSKAMELQKQGDFKMLDLRYGMTTHLMSNLKVLNGMPLEDRRNLANLIKGFFPEEQSFQIFAMLERNSTAAEKAIWREAKASMVISQPAAEIAMHEEEKAVPIMQEFKAPETFKIIGTHSTSSPWGSGSITSLLNDINKSDSGSLANLSDWNPARAGLDTSSTGLRDWVVPATFKETPRLGDYSLNRQPPYPTSLGLQITTTPNALGDSRVSVMLTDGQLTADPYRTRTPKYLDLAGDSDPAGTINITDLLTSNGSTRSSLSSPFDTAPFVGSGVMVINSKTGLLTTKTRAMPDTTPGVIVTGDTNNGAALGTVGYSGAGAAIIKFSAGGTPSVLLDTQSGSFSSNGTSTIKLEKIALPFTDTGKLRTQ